MQEILKLAIGTFIGDMGAIIVAEICLEHFISKWIHKHHIKLNSKNELEVTD